jgi:hypothetical protein
VHLLGHGYLNATSQDRHIGGAHGDASAIACCLARSHGHFGTLIYAPAQSDGNRNTVGDLATRADDHLATLAICIA